MLTTRKQIFERLSDEYQKDLKRWAKKHNQEVTVADIKHEEEHANKRADAVWADWQTAIKNLPRTNPVTGAYEGSSVTDLLAFDPLKDWEGRKAIQLVFFRNTPSNAYIETITVEAARELRDRLNQMNLDTYDTKAPDAWTDLNGNVHVSITQDEID